MKISWNFVSPEKWEPCKLLASFERRCTDNCSRIQCIQIKINLAVRYLGLVSGTDPKGSAGAQAPTQSLKAQKFTFLRSCLIFP